MDYLDFELEVNLSGGRDYKVSVRSPAGEAREIMRFPFDKITLESRLKDLRIALLHSGGQRRQVASPEEKAVKSFGLDLFNALISKEVRVLYDVSKSLAAEADKGLRLILRILDPELAALPWEFLYDPRKAEYVCLSSNTPIVRYPDLAHPVKPLTVKPPLRILGMAVSPSDLNPLDLEREKQRVQEAIERLQGLITLDWLEGQTWEDIQEAMQSGPWHVFHFIGHGGFNPQSDEGLIALSKEDGRTFELSAQKLARLLDHRHLKLVLLNACEGARGGSIDIFSSTASILVRSGIPAVLAMQYEITDAAAIEFSRSFYKAVARGMAIETAVSEARKAVSVAVNNTIEWGTPVLYLRAQNGHLFEVALRQEQIEEIYNDAKKAVSNEDWDAAIEKLTVVLDWNPLNQEAKSTLSHAVEQRKISELYAEGQAHYRAGRLQEALDYLGKVKAVAGNYRDTIDLISSIEEGIKKEHVVSLNAEAEDFIAKGDLNAAIVTLESILEIDSTDEGARGKLTRLREKQELASLYAAGLRHYGAGRWAEALALFVQVAERAGEYEDVKLLIAEAQSKLSEMERQAQAREKLEELYRASKNLYDSGRLEEALESLREIASTAGNYKDVAELIGNAEASLINLERERKAQEQAERVVEAIAPLAVIESPPNLSTPPPGLPRLPIEYAPPPPFPKRRTRWIGPAVVALTLLTIVAFIVLWAVTRGERQGDIFGRNASTQTPTPTARESEPSEPPFTLDPLGELSAEHDLYRVMLSPDGQVVAAVGDASVVRLWTVEDPHALPDLKGASQPSRSIAISPDGAIVASGRDDGTIYLWRIVDGNPLEPLRGHTRYVFNVSFSADGQTLISVSGDRTIRRWSVSDGKELEQIKLPPRQSVVALGPDQRTVALDATDTKEKQKIQLWSLEERRTLVWLAQGEKVSCGAFSMDSGVLAIGSVDGTVRLWRVSDGSLLNTLEVVKGIPSSVTFSPDGQIVATGWRDGFIRLWRVSDGSPLKEWKWLQDAVDNLSFSKDGKTFAAGSMRKIGLWRVRGS